MIAVYSTLLLGLALYALVAGIFLVSENRRPQATIAWLLAFYAAPGLGLLAYVLFGRDRKAFSRRSKLLMQDLESNAQTLLAPLVSKQDAEIAGVETQGAVHRKLTILIRRNSRSVLTSDNRVELLQDARTFYPRLMQDFEAAQHSIHLQYFIWRADECTERLAEILMARANAGVEVRLLYDPLGSQSWKARSYFKRLRAAGIQVFATSPLHYIHMISYRNHRKITIIDGHIGYTGGMNIGKEHVTGGKGFQSWRDTQIRIVGDASRILQAVFTVDWYNAVKEDLFRPQYFPNNLSSERTGRVPVQIVTSGPDSQWAAIRQLYASMITSAERHVYLQSPYFVLDASLAEALRTAALSGIDVKVMLSAQASGDQISAWAGNTYIADIVDSGVRVFLYTKGYLHAKTISVDSRICSVGSANIDIRSFSINYELNAVIYDERLTRQLEADFHGDLESCTEFDVEQYESRGTLIRFRDSVARVLSPLL